MADMWAGYDAWLERPYQERYVAGEAYCDWLDENDYDPNDDHWEEYELAKQEERDAALEAKAEQRYEDKKMGYDDYDF